MASKKRFAALLIAAVLCFALTFSALGIAVNSGHDCVGEHCGICALIVVCRNVLDTVLAAVCAVGVLSAVYFSLSVTESGSCGFFRTPSPISLKVKLSD